MKRGDIVVIREVLETADRVLINDNTICVVRVTPHGKQSVSLEVIRGPMDGYKFVTQRANVQTREDYESEQRKEEEGGE